MQYSTFKSNSSALLLLSLQLPVIYVNNFTSINWIIFKKPLFDLLIPVVLKAGTLGAPALPKKCSRLSVGHGKNKGLKSKSKQSVLGWGLVGALLELKRGVPLELGKQFCPWEVKSFWMTFARCAGGRGRRHCVVLWIDDAMHTEPSSCN